ncbi:MAG: hypothetical protein M1828_006970 [Chrysothrix sp. TS-e1954]|nr:MAG: hypothetical protein M1828_006970 [Chrysothrix sp. TS-e1954]
MLRSRVHGLGAGTQSRLTAHCRHLSDVREIEDHQLKDVRVDSLAETLEAHRASNRASLIRHTHHETKKTDKSGALTRYFRSFDPEKAQPEQPIIRKQPAKPKQQHYSPFGRIHARRQWLDNEQVLRSFGSYIEPTFDWVAPSQSTAEERFRTQRPYLQDPEDLAVGLQRSQTLDDCIRGLEAWLTITQEESIARETLTSRITNQLRRIVSEDTNLIHFGSMKTGLAMPTSDTDIGLWVPSIHERGYPSRSFRISTASILKKIHDSVKLEEGVDVKPLLGIKFPLLRYIFRRSNFEVQVVSAPSSDGAEELVRGYMDEFPQLKPIYMVLRVALQARSLDSPATGGLSSYCLIMMMVKFLRSGRTSRRDDLGHTLIGFLNYWASRSTNDYAFCPDPSAIWEKRDYSMAVTKKLKKLQQTDPLEYWRDRLAMRMDEQPYLLTMQDPARWDNDIGRHTYRIMDIRTTFAKLASFLQQWRASSNKATEDPFDRFFGSRLARIQAQRSDLIREAGTMQSYEAP